MPAHTRCNITRHKLPSSQVVVQKGPEEKERGSSVGASGAAADRRRLTDVLERVGAMGSERARALFASKHLEQDLGKLLKVRGVCVLSVLLCVC